MAPLLRSAVLLVVIVSFVAADAHAQSAAGAASDTAIAARALVPLLRDVRRRIDPQVTVQPGRLPNSPFTGRNSTLFAVTIGVDAMDVDEDTLKAMNRLLEWNRREPLSARDRALVAAWLDVLQIKVLGRMAAGGRGIGCDKPCVVQRLTNPDSLFGPTGREQIETRDFILLDALSEAVEESQ